MIQKITHPLVEYELIEALDDGEGSLLPCAPYSVSTYENGVISSRSEDATERDVRERVLSQRPREEMMRDYHWYPNRGRPEYKRQEYNRYS